MKFENEFSAGKKKKIQLWGNILEEIQNVDPFFKHNKFEIKKKWDNLITTYKRIKKRNSATGRDATTWDYYEIFDANYGTRHNITPPSNLLSSSSTFADQNTSPNIFTETGLVVDHSNNDEDDEEVIETPQKKRRIQKNDELLDFFKKEAIEEAARHKELVLLEKEKMETERIRVDLIKNLAETLCKMSN